MSTFSIRIDIQDQSDQSTIFISVLPKYHAYMWHKTYGCLDTVPNHVLHNAQVNYIRWVFRALCLAKTGMQLLSDAKCAMQQVTTQPAQPPWSTNTPHTTPQPTPTTETSPSPRAGLT